MFIPCGAIGPLELVVIVLVVLLLFGGRKIPELMRGLGRGVKEFKDAVNKDYPAEETPTNRKDDASGKESEK